MIKLMLKVAAVAVASAVVTIAHTGSAQAFSFKVTEGIAGANGATDHGAFSEFNGQKGFMNVDFDNGQAPTTGFAQYSYTSGNRSSVRSDVWAPTSLTGERNNTNYLAVFHNDDVNIKLASNFNYYGINWGAISNNNTFTFYKGDQLVKSFNTQDINPLATVYAAHQGERNAYVHFYADNASEVFDRIVVSQSSEEGGGFETDNHSFHMGNTGFDWNNPTKTPEPAAMVGLAVVSGAAWLKRKQANR